MSGAAVFSTHAYLQAHYVQAAWWAVAFLAAAIAGAAGVAAAQESRWLSRSRYLRGLACLLDPSTQSGWWIAFRPGLDAGYQVHVGCTLDDGSYVSGRLRSYSQMAEDTPDRDLVLRAPIWHRPRGAAEAREAPNVTWMTLSARHIVTMAVTYVEARHPSLRPSWLRPGPPPRRPGGPATGQLHFPRSHPAAHDVPDALPGSRRRHRAREGSAGNRWLVPGGLDWARAMDELAEELLRADGPAGRAVTAPLDAAIAVRREAIGRLDGDLARLRRAWICAITSLSTLPPAIRLAAAWRTCWSPAR